MTDVTLRIKNLSISLEALSRVNCEGSSSLYIEVDALLRKEISNAHKEQNPLKTVGNELDDTVPF